MSIQSEINRIKSGVAAAYAAVAEKGGTLPGKQNSANLAAAVQSIPTSNIPSGFIGMWSGAANAIPSGWALCNGTNGTPDLRNRFVVGAGSSYSVGAKGGSDTVTLTAAQMPSHVHEVETSSDTSYQGIGVLAVHGGSSMSTSAAGGSQPHENRPPYYALCFIMKQ